MLLLFLVFSLLCKCITIPRLSTYDMFELQTKYGYSLKQVKKILRAIDWLSYSHSVQVSDRFESPKVRASVYNQQRILSIKLFHPTASIFRLRFKPKGYDHTNMSIDKNDRVGYFCGYMDDKFEFVTIPKPTRYSKVEPQKLLNIIPQDAIWKSYLKHLNVKPVTRLLPPGPDYLDIKSLGSYHPSFIHPWTPQAMLKLIAVYWLNQARLNHLPLKPFARSLLDTVFPGSETYLRP